MADQSICSFFQVGKSTKHVKTEEYKTDIFDRKWLNDADYCQWLKPGSDNTTYRCKVCKEKRSERKLGDMGVGALKKHAKSPGHGDNLNTYLSTLSFFEAKQPRASSNSAPIVEEQPSVSEPIPSLFKKSPFIVVMFDGGLNQGPSTQ